MLIASDRGIMGNHRNGHAAQVLGWGATGLMTVAALLYLALNYL